MVQEKKIVGETDTAEKVADQYLRRARKEVRTSEVVSHVMTNAGATKGTAHQALTSLKKSRRADQPRKGWWISLDPHDPELDSVEEDMVPTNAAIIFMDLDTNEVWATAELCFRVTVHKPKRIGGRKATRNPDGEGVYG